MAPGLRVGWVVAAKEIIKKLSVAKQSVDLCTSAFNQLVCAEFLKQGHLEPHIEKVKKIYAEKRSVMLQALDTYMPKNAGISWTKPEGGLFLWVTLPEYINADEMFKEAVDQKVAYVIGSAFHCNGYGQNTMRLNFSYPTKEAINEGIQRLAKTIKNRLK